MKKAATKRTRSRVADPDEPLPEYDLRGGVRGKYAHMFTAGMRLVELDPELDELFPDDASVNEALRALAAIIRRRDKGTKGTARTKKAASRRQRPR